MENKFARNLSLGLRCKFGPIEVVSALIIIHIFIFLYCVYLVLYPINGYNKWILRVIYLVLYFWLSE